MKKIAFLLAMLTTVPAVANEYWEDVSDFDYDMPSISTTKRDTYVGIRLHKNERLAFKYDIHDGGNTTIRKDNWGFGATVGNRLSNHVNVEFETMYTGAQQTKRGTNFEFDVWTNMLNVYLFQEFEDAIAPYAGLGIGFATIWGDVGNMSDTVFDLSFSAMIGVNFALNDRIDLNLGVKYQYYGEVEHKIHNQEYAITDIDATEFYFGAAYKFGL